MLVVPWKLVTLHEKKRTPGLNATVYHCYFLYAYIIETRCITNRKIIVFLSRLHFGLQFLDLLQKNQACGNLKGPRRSNTAASFNGCIFSAAQSEKKSFQPINRKTLSRILSSSSHCATCSSSQHVTKTRPNETMT